MFTASVVSLMSVLASPTAEPPLMSVWHEDGSTLCSQVETPPPPSEWCWTADGILDEACFTNPVPGVPYSNASESRRTFENSATIVVPPRPYVFSSWSFATTNDSPRAGHAGRIDRPPRA